MAVLGGALELPRCPHCNVNRPYLKLSGTQVQTHDHKMQNPRTWRVYACANCGGPVIAGTVGTKVDHNSAVSWHYPSSGEGVDSDIPERARDYLAQAIASSGEAAAGAVMLAASAVDAMLKEKQYIDGTLNARIDKAAADHLITEGMKEWAHEVRLDANDQRHSDQHAALPTSADAKRAIDFAQALAMFLFVLPARVQRGKQAALMGKSQ